MDIHGLSMDIFMDIFMDISMDISIVYVVLYGRLLLRFSQALVLKVLVSHPLLHPLSAQP